MKLSTGDNKLSRSSKVSAAAVLLWAVVVFAGPWCQSQASDRANSWIPEIMDTSYAVRMAARDSLIAVGGEAVDELVILLKDQFANDTLRGRAAFILGKIGPKAEEATPAFIDIIRNDRSQFQLRINAITAIGEIGPKAWDAIEVLRKILQNEEDEYTKQITVSAIGGLGYRAEEAIPELLLLYFNTQSYDLRLVIDSALTRIGPRAADTLVSLVRDTSLHEYYRKRLINVLGDIGTEAFFAVDDLASIVADTSESMEIRGSAAKTLGSFGGFAKSAIPILIRAMGEDGTWPSRNARQSLIEIGDAALDQLIEVTRDPTEDRARRAGAISVIGAMGPKGGGAVPFLVEILLDTTLVDGPEWRTSLYDYELRHGSIEALGRIGADALPAVPCLIDNLGSSFTNDRSAAAVALTRIAESCVDEEKTEAIPALEAAYDSILSNEFIGSSRAEWNDEHVGRFNRALESLRLIDQTSIVRQFVSYLEQNPRAKTASGVVSVYAIVTLICFAIFFARPLWLLRINDFLKDWLSSKTGSAGPVLDLLRYAAVVRLFHYRQRVLDAWVKQHVRSVRDNFDKIPCVAERLNHVDVPFSLNGREVSDSRDPAIRALFEDRRVRILIRGMGGSGKSSIAFQLGRLALSADKARRLNQKHLMIPIVIGGEFHSSNDTTRIVVKTAQGLLSDLIGSDYQVDVALVQRLMQTRRLLIIIDGLSELSEASRSLVSPASAEFPANALIVTSRTKENLAGVSINEAKPHLLRHNSLFGFIDSYLVAADCRESFDDDDFAEAVGNLSKMVAGRQIPVMIVRLYADEMLAFRRGSLQLSETIPELIERYVGKLNESVQPNRIETRFVHQGLQAIGWKCVGRNYQPEAVSAADAEEILRRSGSDLGLSYLTDRLQVLQLTGRRESSVRFSLDPVAEYYAAMYKINDLGNETANWQRLIQDIRSSEEFPEGTSGFCLALYDCAVASVNQGEVEEERLTEVLSLTMIDEDELRKLQVRRRIRRMRENLRAVEIQDKLAACVNARDLGSDAFLLTDDLIQCLRSNDSESLLRECVITLSDTIGTPAIPTLIRSCNDSDSGVRLGSTEALANIQGIEDDILQVLLSKLLDKSHRVRKSAVIGLIGHMGWPCPQQIRTDFCEKLPALLTDDSVDVRIAAVQALIVLKHTPSSIAYQLYECTQSESEELVETATMALATLPYDCWQTSRDAIRRLIGHDAPRVLLAVFGLISKLSADRVFELYPELSIALQNVPSENIRLRYKWEVIEEIAYTSRYDYRPAVSASYTGAKSISSELCQALAAAGEVGVPDLLGILGTTGVEEIRMRILTILAMMSGRGAEASPDAIKLAHEGTKRERIASVCAIGQMRVTNKDVEDCLRECDQDADGELRDQARIALEKLGYRTDKGFPAA